MTDVKTPVGASAQAPKRKRGINNETKAVAQLKFHEKDAAQNGLFIGHLDEAKVEWSTNEDSRDFPGLAMPRLSFHFASNHPNVSERRHVYYTIFPVPSNVQTIIGGAEEWKVNNVFNWIKHILDTFYFKGRPMTEAEEDALSLPFDDMDDEGNYNPVDPQEVLDGYRAIFDNAVSMLNGTFAPGNEEASGKPCYKTADGKPLSIWMKLLRHKKRKNDWINVSANGELGFDSFLGSGVIELFKKDVMPTRLRLDVSKESITPKETKKAPSIGNPAMPGMITSGFEGGGQNDFNPFDPTFADGVGDPF